MALTARNLKGHHHALTDAYTLDVGAQGGHLGDAFVSDREGRCVGWGTRNRLSGAPVDLMRGDPGAQHPAQGMVDEDRIEIATRHGDRPHQRLARSAELRLGNLVPLESTHANEG
jgi:hypothetical protein